jgi:DNA-binding response OmpR family regulator
MTPPQSAPPRRVMLVDDDALVLGVAGDLLHAGGYAVQLLMYPTLTVATAQQFNPDLIILDINMPVLSGREVLHSLKAFEKIAHVPVIFLTSELSPRDQVRAFLGGAVDVWSKPVQPEHVDRLGEIFAMLDAMERAPTPAPAQSQRQLLLKFFIREKSTGSLVVNPATPFEGRAIFDQGLVTHARMGPLEDEAAIDEMLSAEDGSWRWEAGVTTLPSAPAQKAAPSSGYKPRVLLVDDDPALRKLYGLQLERSGFEVVAADHGEEGHRLALESQFDMMVADLNMPVLDGWGMLKLLKGSARTRELPVLVLSAHDDYRETLKAARSGAHDYLRKTGHADELVKRVRTLAAPRVAAWEELRTGQPLKRFEVSQVGAQWLLRALGEQDCTGMLEASDDWGSYRMKVDRGHLVEGLAEAGAKKATGIHAVSAFIVSRGAEASFTPFPPGADEPQGPWLVEAVTESCNNVAALEQRITDERLKRATVFSVDPELASLFDRIGSAADLRILRAIVEKKVDPSKLASHLELSQEAIDAGLKELVRRGVVRV